MKLTTLTAAAFALTTAHAWAQDQGTAGAENPSIAAAMADATPATPIVFGPTIEGVVRGEVAPGTDCLVPTGRTGWWAAVVCLADVAQRRGNDLATAETKLTEVEAKLAEAEAAKATAETNTGMVDEARVAQAVAFEAEATTAEAAKTAAAALATAYAATPDQLAQLRLHLPELDAVLKAGEEAADPAVLREKATTLRSAAALMP